MCPFGSTIRHERPPDEASERGEHVTEQNRVGTPVQPGNKVTSGGMLPCNMGGVSDDSTNAVLNRTTMKVHKHEKGTETVETRCGATYHLDPEQLLVTSVERATTEFDASKCGRCFEDGGGY